MAKKTVSSDTSMSAVETTVQSLAVQAHPFESWIQKSSLQSEVEFTQADAVLGSIKALIAQAEEKRTGFVKPLNGVVKAINADFKKVTAPLEKLEEHIKHRLMSPYIYEKQAAAMKAAEKIAKKEEKKGNEQFANDVRAAAAEETGIPADVTITTREQWKGRVTNLAQLLQTIAASPALQAQLNGALVEVLEKTLSQLARVSKCKEAAPAGSEFYTELVIGKGI